MNMNTDDSNRAFFFTILYIIFLFLRLKIDKFDLENVPKRAIIASNRQHVHALLWQYQVVSGALWTLYDYDNIAFKTWPYQCQLICLFNVLMFWCYHFFSLSRSLQFVSLTTVCLTHLIPCCIMYTNRSGMRRRKIIIGKFLLSLVGFNIIRNLIGLLRKCRKLVVYDRIKILNEPIKVWMT